MKRAAFVLLPLVLAACGQREPLRLPAGEEPVPAEAMASAPPTTDELLTPPPIARPVRVDELLRRSDEREADRFDLPPGDIAVDESNNDGDEPEL
jgi:predicted small lipoprotein YifL